MNFTVITWHIPAYDQVSCHIVKKSLTDFPLTVHLYAKSANVPYFNKASKSEALLCQVLYSKNLIKMTAGHFGYACA